MKTSKLRQSAKGECCDIRIPEVCLWDDESVVLCHLPDGTGGKMGGKSSDLHSVYGCGPCHAVVDGRQRIPHLSREEIELYALQGHMRSLGKFQRKGLIHGH